MDVFATEDLFVVGIGFDIAGAYLVARGLLASPVQIARRSATYVGYSSLDAVGQVKDRVDGMIGLVALVAGFVLQAAAYALVLTGRSPVETGAGRGVAAAFLGVLAVLLVLVVRQLIGRRLVMRTLVEVASVNHYGRPAEICSKPYSARLNNYARELGYTLRDGEDGMEFARRVFGVDEVEPGDASRD